jgi:thioredoxin reductase
MTVDVAIVGAGPYGLSIAAHLSSSAVDFRIFGIPMHAWKAHMPAGMHLKSDGSSSDLADPEGDFTLKAFCAEAGYAHHPTEKPVSLKCFVDYGLAFQKRFVDRVEPKLLVSLEKQSKDFRLTFDDGDVVIARRVLLAVGIERFKHVPDILGNLPPELLSHSSQYGPIGHLSGRRVAVLGAGASALDLAALLHEAGADAFVVTRRPSVEFHGAPGHRALWRRMARPTSGIGNGWRLRIFSGLPQLFHALPEKQRRHQVGTLLGPSTGWFMKERIVGRVPLLTSRTPEATSISGGQVKIRVSAANGEREEIAADHVIAATGYRIDLRRLSFLTDELRALIQTEGGAPSLSRNFESSVPGLYFVGPTSMVSFGPVVRFVYGARYTARRLSRHLAASRTVIQHAGLDFREKAIAPEMAANPDPTSP